MIFYGRPEMIEVEIKIRTDLESAGQKLTDIGFVKDTFPPVLIGFWDWVTFSSLRSCQKAKIKMMH